GGTIPFTISALPPDHVDLLVDAVPIVPNRDAVVDSIVIGMLENNAEAYAVIRDVNQTYLNHATNPVWTVHDPSVVTVTRSATVPSRCILTKVNAGSTWLVVNHAPNLKPDSTLVITYVLPQHPVIVSGVMRDNDADLVPDLLSLTLSDTFKVDQRLDSVRIAYKGLLITVPGSGVTMRGMQLDVPVPASVGVDGRPSGTATIFMTVGGEPKNSARGFTDGVCPAVIAADVLENDGSNPDVLYITFSEPLTIGTIVGRQLLLIPQGTTDTVALTITQILSQTNDSTFAVQIASTDPKARAGDRLRLIPGSAGGTLADRSSNKAHDLNRSVIIGFRPGAASIAGAWYRDANADGVIDQVVVRFKRKVEQSEVDTALIYRDLRQLKLPFSASTRINDSMYRISIAGMLNAINTRGPMELTVGYRALPGIRRSTIVADSAAPVIVSARLVPGALTAAGTRGSDTLVVAFSEGVVRPGQSPFLLSAKKDGQRYSVTLAYIDTTPALYSYRFVVQSISNAAIPLPLAGDTIWINPTAGVSDSLGNPQANPANRRVLLQVDWPQAEWRIVISSNPFTHDAPITAPTFGGGKGTAIVLRPTTPVDETRIRAWITIYDAVGNIVKTSDFAPFNGGLRMEWNGDNRNGRYVGTGAYLALIKAADGSSREFSRTVRLGVKGR
ncbi:MAG: hypothetical protein JXA71_11165, partial [Chitinispirillaceae bacterium]|nr:hypothetical protein [Chitinispirillaceae bacterium]